MRYYRTIKFLIFFIFCLSQISFADENLLSRTFEGHTNTVWSVSFSPDGRYLASGSNDNTIKLSDVSDGSLIRTLEGHTEPVMSVSFSPDGKYLASGSGDETIKLWRVSDGSLIKTLKGHTDWVYSVSFSPDGKYLASGSGDETIKLWRVSDGSLIRTLEKHTVGVLSVSFSPDGKYLASGSKDKTIKLWRVSDGSLIRTLEGHTGSVWSVSFSPDGKYLASGSWDKTIKLWRVSDGSLIRTLDGHTYSVVSVSFSPDGKYLASGSGDETIKLWRVSDGSLIRTLKGHTNTVWSVSFSPDGKYLASGTWDKTIKLWNVEDGSLIRTLEGHTGGVESVSFSPDGKYLASGSDDKRIKAEKMEAERKEAERKEAERKEAERIKAERIKAEKMEAERKEPERREAEREEKRKQLIIGILVILLILSIFPIIKYKRWSLLPEKIKSNIGNIEIASVLFDKYIKSYYRFVGKFSLTKFTPGELFSIFSQLKRLDDLIVADRYKLPEQYFVYFFDELVKSGDYQRASKIYQKLKIPYTSFEFKIKGHTNTVYSVSFSPDGKYLASGSWDETIKLWDVSDGSLIRTLEGHTGWVYSVSFSPDGKYLASGSGDETIKLWRVSDGHLIMALEGHTGYVWSVSFSPDGKYLASGSTDKTIKLWDVSDGSLIRTLEGHTDFVRSVSFSPDGKYLASGSWDKTIKLWDVSDGSLIRTLKGHTDHVESVSFSPDDKYLASGSTDKTIKLWDVSDGSLIRTLKGHTDHVESVSFSPDGKYLASGSYDNTIKLWNVEYGSFLIRTLKGHTDHVESVSFSPDGKYLASGSYDNTIKLWPKFNIEPENVYKLFKGLGEIDKLPDEKLPDSCIIYILKQLVKDKDFQNAYLFLKHSKEELYLDKIDKYEFLSIHAGLNKLEELSEMVNLPAEWFLEYIKHFYNKNEIDKAYLMAKNAKVLYTSLSEQDVNMLYSLYKKVGKTKELIEYVCESKVDESVYTGLKNELLNQKEYRYFVDIFKAGIKRYGDMWNEKGWKSFIESYSELNQMEKINPSDIPAEYWEIVIGTLENEKKFEALKAFLLKIPEKTWPITAYKLWFEACLRTGALYEAMKSPSEIKERSDREEVFNMYYKLGLELEKEGNIEAACAIYEKFVNEFVSYKDIPSRYQKLLIGFSGGISGGGQSIKKHTSYNETIVGGTQTSGSNYIGKKYDLVREIGRGGMGIVYEAVNKEIGKKVAIKKMKEELAINIREKKRFLDEAKRVAELHHPNIVDIYDMFEESGNTYLVFEYIDGETVENILNRKTRFSFEESRRIILGVCSALGYAHNKRIIHRDIKPSNIMVIGDSMSAQRLDWVKVMDFGIAREVKDTLSRLTRQETSGTMAYMAPEQHLGMYDARSDIYSLGVTICEMLTGEPPFKGPDFLAQKERMVFRPVTELVPEIPKKINEIISKCLQADKEKRYNSVEELVKELKS